LISIPESPATIPVKLTTEFSVSAFEGVTSFPREAALSLGCATGAAEIEASLAEEDMSWEAVTATESAPCWDATDCFCSDTINSLRGSFGSELMEKTRSSDVSIVTLVSEPEERSLFAAVTFFTGDDSGVFGSETCPGSVWERSITVRKGSFSW